MIKFIVEVLLAIFLHPVAFVLCVIDIVNRKEMGGVSKVLWIIISFFWGIGPILYILLGGGTFWSSAESVRDRAATRALVLGLLALWFAVLAPFAIWSGFRSWRRIRASEGELNGAASAMAGLVAGLIGLATIVIGAAYWLSA